MGAPFPGAVVYIGPDEKRFAQVFADIGWTAPTSSEITGENDTNEATGVSEGKPIDCGGKRTSLAVPLEALRRREAPNDTWNSGPDYTLSA